MALGDYYTDDGTMLPGYGGIRRRQLGDEQAADAGLFAPQAPPPMESASGGNTFGKEGSGTSAREGAVGEAPPESPGQIFEPPRMEMAPPPDQGGPMGGGGGSQAAPPRPEEPMPVASQPPNPEAQMPQAFTPMQDPMTSGQQAQAAFPIQRRPVVPMTGAANTQGGTMLGQAGGLLGGGLGVPGAMGTSQSHTDISNLIANLYKLANQSTQTY